MQVFRLVIFVANHVATQGQPPFIGPEEAALDADHAVFEKAHSPIKLEVLEKWLQIIFFYLLFTWKHNKHFFLFNSFIFVLYSLNF